MAIINLEQLAEAFAVSLPTARKLIREPDFPIEKDGGPGLAYEFDSDKVLSWNSAKKLADLKAKYEAEAAVEQLKLDLMGGMTIDPGRQGLSPQEAKASIEAELAATKLAEMRGELVRADALRDVLRNAFTKLRTNLLALAPKIADSQGLDTMAEAQILSLIEAELRHCKQQIAGQA